VNRNLGKEYMSKHKKHCIHGHALTGENLRIKHKTAGVYPNSKRGAYENYECAECHRIDNRNWWHNKKNKLRNMSELYTRQQLAHKDNFINPKSDNN
jgi:hypothetical protein